MARDKRRAGARRANPLDRAPWLPFTPLDLCLAVLIVAAAAGVYSPVRHNDFVSHDDPVYVTANAEVQAGLTWHGVKWAFTTNHDGNWFPLTWISHMADVQAFGLRSGAHHAVNVALHLLSTLLLFLWLRHATGARWPAALVALLFGLHPLHVESVAWASERKDVLSGVFWMLTFSGYVYYVRQPGWRRYLLVLLPFALGLMSKPMIVTLPFVLLLLDVWPLERLSIARIGTGNTAGASQAKAWNLRPEDAPRRFRPAEEAPRRFRPFGRDGAGVLFEKAPLLALAAVSATVTLLVQSGAGAVAALQQVPLGTRIANALVAYGAYASSFAWPTRLAVFYPYHPAIPGWQVLSAASFIIVVSVLAWRQRSARPYFAVGWCWFLGTLVPVIGLVQVGGQAHADRYMYIPLVGLSIALAWGLADLVRSRPRTRVAVAGAAVVCCCGCAVLTRYQVRQWRDDRTLFQHALDVTVDNAVAHDGLGRVLRAEGRLDEAMAQFREAVRIDPAYAGSRDNLGVALLAQGRPQEAAEQSREAVRLDPNLAQAHLTLAAALHAMGQGTEAMAEYAEAARRWPDNATARAGLGLALAEHGRPDEGLAEIREAIRLAPRFADGHYNLARVLMTLGRRDEAVAEFSDALRLKPDFAEGHFNLANLLAQMGRMEDAIAEYRAAVRLKPDDVAARCNLGSALASVGRTDEAIAQFTEALRLRPNFGPARTNLEYARQARDAAARRGRNSIAK